MEPVEQELVQRLAQTPAWLRAALTAGDHRLAAAEPDHWGIGDIIRHIRAADAIMSTRVFQILVREGAPLPAFDERAWGGLLAASGIPLEDQVAEFALRRAELVAMLRSLTPDQWQLSGQHELAGSVTVADVCRSVAEHESEHRAQLEGIVRG